MTLRRMFPLVAAAVLLTPALAGCGGSGKPSATPTSSEPKRTKDLAMRVAKCGRDNGVPNMPDPIQDKDGEWDFPDMGDNLKVPKACEELVRQWKAAAPKGAPGGGKPKTAAEMALLRKFAVCMRQHGIPDWPDPKADGSFVMLARLTPDDPSFKTAERTCRTLIKGKLDFMIIQPESAGSGGQGQP